MSYDFESIWIIGASSGIGRAVAERLAKDGVKVAISARSSEKLQALVETYPAYISAHPLDVTDHEAVKSTAEALDAQFDGLGCMMYCAAAWDSGEKTSITPESFRPSLEINLVGAIAALAAVQPLMEARGKGRIALISSVAGYRGLPNAAEYGTTKAALIHLCESMKFTLDAKNIVMQVITPGFVETPLTDKNDFPMPFLISAEKAANYIARGLQSKSFEITFPKRFTYQLKALRMLPHWLYFALIARATRGQS